jgi:succinate-acetate transporter protein
MGLPPPPPPPAEAKPEAWANPAVVGLMGFGTTTMLAGLSNMPAPYVNGFAGNWTVFGMALFFGGMAQLIAGIIALRKGNLFAGSAFVGYGGFWLAYTYMLAGAGGAAFAAAPVLAYGIAGFAFVWMMFTFTFMINAPKHGWGILLVFVLLFFSFIMLVVKFASIASDPANSPFITSGGSGADNWAVAVPIIAAGVMAWYVATATLTNWNYGRRVLPE